MLDFVSILFIESIDTTDLLDDGDFCEDNAAVNELLMAWILEQRQKANPTVWKLDGTHSLRNKRDDNINNYINDKFYIDADSFYTQ